MKHLRPETSEYIPDTLKPCPANRPHQHTCIMNPGKLILYQFNIKYCTINKIKIENFSIYLYHTYEFLSICVLPINIFLIYKYIYKLIYIYIYFVYFTIHISYNNRK